MLRISLFGMSRCQLMLSTFIVLALNAQQCPAQISSVELPSPQKTISPEQDDATLHDVTFVGQKSGWAVGNRGAIWKTTDGGTSWTFVPTLPGVDKFSLQSACFLTDRVGWIAGGSFIPFSQTHIGIVLFTNDGGATWTAQGNGLLPYLKQVRFFDLERGIAIGEKSTTFPGGILQTADGGKTWSAANSTRNGPWSAGAWVSPSDGFVVGVRGRSALFSNGTLRDGLPAVENLRHFRDVTMNANGRAWIVGDGAMVLMSQDQGISWEPPRTSFPNDVLESLNLTSVATHGSHVWIAGAPGSVVWHSADNGISWDQQRTGSSSPIESITFSDENHGSAVGAFGRILRTVDGGQNWTTVRGGQRRLACLAIHSDASRPSMTFLTRWALEAGYRISHCTMVRRDLGVDAHSANESELRLQHAAMLAGGTGTMQEWRFPLSAPGMERDQKRLIQSWSEMTEHRLAEVMLTGLVARIRTWQPEIILLDEPSRNDVPADMLHKAVLKAVELARDPQFQTQQSNVLGLAPWNVRKVVLQRPIGQHGAITQSAFQILPHLNTTLDQAASEAVAVRGGSTSELTTPSVHEVVKTDGTVSDQSLFSDLNLIANGPARRVRPSIRSTDYERLMEQVQQRKTVTAICQRAMSSNRGGDQLLGQLQQMLRPLSPEQSARQLTDIAEMARKQENWSLAEATYAELITRYPDQPMAIDGMLWLVQFWSSSEMNWQRLRHVSGKNSEFELDRNIVQTNFEEAKKILEANTTKIGSQAEMSRLTSPFQESSSDIVTTSGDLGSVFSENGNASNQKLMMTRRWDEMAGLVSSRLKESYPRLFEEPELEFSLAALARRRGQPKVADEIYGRYLQLLNDDPWHVAAAGEIWLLRRGALSPKPTANSKRSKIAPVLDGDLGDLCWTQAKEIRLGDSTDESIFVGTGQAGGSVQFQGERPIVFMCHDERFLYLAARIPIHPELPESPVQQGGRTHDSDLGLHDQLRIQLDTDRDYGSYYEFIIDQRGWTRDRCWESTEFNPKWYVATLREDRNWNLEIAIPFSELTGAVPTNSSTWGLGLTRVMPGIDSQSWSNSGAMEPMAAQFGFLEFVE